MLPIRHASSVRLPIALAGLCLLVSGCGSANNLTGSSPTGAPAASSSAPAAAAPPYTPGVLRGQAQAGPSQISGAHIYLFAANLSGYGTPSVSLLDPAAPGVSTDALGSYVVTDSTGDFNLTGGYRCTPGQLVYILAHGGSPGGETDNPGVALLSVFGTCPAAGNFTDQISFVNLNQVSTVISVYALAGFLTDSTHVGAGTSDLARVGITNAFNTVGNLLDLGLGAALPYTPSGSGVVPAAAIGTLANLIVPCTNVASACAALFALAPDTAGHLPTDTVQALHNISRAPTANVAALFGLAGGQPFRPTLASAPNDWTLGITFYAETMAGPYFPAVDAAGNLWVPGYANNTLTEFDPLGNLLSGDKGFTGSSLAQPFSVAVDASGNAWVSSFGTPSSAPTVTGFAPNGTSITPSGIRCGTACTFLSIDTSQNLWVSGTPQIAVLRSSGATLSAFNPNSTSSGIAIDSLGHGWAIGSGRNLSRLTVPGAITQFTEGVTVATGTELNGVAIDADDNIWFTSPKNNALGKFSNTGIALSPTAGFTGGGLRGPTGIAIDGAGTVWVANRDSNSVSAFTASGKPLSNPSGYFAEGVSNPRGIAVDPSGNVWVTSSTGNAVTQFLGAGTPTATPLTPLNHGRRP